MTSQGYFKELNIKQRKFHKKELRDSKQLEKVFKIADEISHGMESLQKDIRKVHKKGASSQDIQNVLLKLIEGKGFKSEKTGLFESYSTNQLRPDYFLKLNKTDGIIIEIERGKTTTNNMDMLDLWKSHICKEANHLFLIVPMEVNHTKRIFHNVCKRIGSFFEFENYINIDSVTIFGYGDES